MTLEEVILASLGAPLMGYLPGWTSPAEICAGIVRNASAAINDEHDLLSWVSQSMLPIPICGRMFPGWGPLGQVTALRYFEHVLTVRVEWSVKGEKRPAKVYAVLGYNPIRIIGMMPGCPLRAEMVLGQTMTTDLACGAGLLTRDEARVFLRRPPR